MSTTIEQRDIGTARLRFSALTCGSDGPLALCLHGFPDSAHTWRHLLPALADAGFRAVAPWTRGYAPTDIPADADYSVAALAADANALHEALDADGDAVLVGHDWGAATAYSAASDAPQRWRRVVTMAVPPPAALGSRFLTYRQLRASFYMYVFQMPFAEAVVAAEDFDFVAQLWRDWSPSYDASVDLPLVKDALRDPEHLSAAVGYYRALFGAGGGSGTPAQPTLYLHGGADGCMLDPPTTAAEAGLGEHSRVDVLPGLGHFLHLEDPETVNGRILDWFA